MTRFINDDTKLAEELRDVPINVGAPILKKTTLEHLVVVVMDAGIAPRRGELAASGGLA